MISKLWIRKALSMCLAVAILATYSMVALAGSDRMVGELSISGKAVKGESPAVTVNGEIAQSGRSIFSSSTIITPQDASAIINVAKIGKVELAPNTTLTLSFDEKGLSGDLLAGKITVLGASESVNIKTPDGKIAKLNVGESAVAAKAQTDDDNDGGAAWWLYALIFGGAIAGILIAATTDNNRIALGGSTTVASPNR